MQPDVVRHSILEILERALFDDDRPQDLQLAFRRPCSREQREWQNDPGQHDGNPPLRATAATVPWRLLSGTARFAHAYADRSRNRPRRCVIVHDWQIRHWTHGWKSDDDRPT